MEIETAAACLEALGNSTRLEILRLLIRAGKPGVSVGEIQAEVGIPASTLSHHLGRLVQTGIASQERQSRTLICRANFGLLRDILRFLADDCCAGVLRR